MAALSLSLSSLRPLAASAVLLAAPAFASTGTNDLWAGKLTTAADCGCSGKADCTCKKGACKCAKCGKGSKSKVIDALKNNPDTAKLPETARFDATAGVFI